MMKKILLATVMLAMNSTTLNSPATAVQIPVTTEHRPNDFTVACLEAPTRDCAFSAALKTVIAEEFGVERAKVLIGVSRSLIKTGKIQQGREYLMVALDEARSVNLSLVTQGKISEIAPLLARAGDDAGALALVEEITNPTIKDRVLYKIAEEAAANGMVADVRVALRQTSNQKRAFWRELSLLARVPKAALVGLDMEAMQSKVRGAEFQELKYRGLIQLAVLADRMGRPGDRNALIAEADELFSSLVGMNLRANATADRARNMFDAGMDDAFVNASYKLALLHGGKLRGQDALATFATKIGAVDAATGNLEIALDRLENFEETDKKAAYLATLRGGGDNSMLAARARDLLVEIAEMDGAYERDLVRLTLLEGALANVDLSLARQIIEAIEDDDNQAFGLALMAPLLD